MPNDSQSFIRVQIMAHFNELKNKYIDYSFLSLFNIHYLFKNVIISCTAYGFRQKTQDKRIPSNMVLLIFYYVNIRPNPACDVVLTLPESAYQ